jgi:predicted ribosome quality control (RQC) complex YloA/Tae2 family protein
VLTLPFDGIVTKCIAEELAEQLSGGRIDKIFQPEADEIRLYIRSQDKNHRLLISASPNYPRIHLTETTKDNPSTAPTFCMLLRKHIAGGRILDIESSHYERIITIHIESIDELGDSSVKKLVVEIMGKHSNIILLNPENKIIDAIKHIGSDINRVREVLPARPYTLPPAQNKISPDKLDIKALISDLDNNNIRLDKYILESIQGFSPLLCRELCYRSAVESKRSANSLLPDEITSLEAKLTAIIKEITKSSFKPMVLYGDKGLSKPVDFHCINISQLEDKKLFNSMSEAMDYFYYSKDLFERLKQKQSSLVKVINNSLDRCKKKLAIHQNNLREAADRDKLRLYGELITANIYRIPKGLKSVSLPNYYTEGNKMVEVPLDENKSPQANAQIYFKKYAKAKSRFAYAKIQIEDTLQEINYLESVLQMLGNCVKPEEIDEVRQELSEQGYITAGKSRNGKINARNRKSKKAAKNAAGSKPLHFKSSDGYDIFVGKNNKQNDMLTLKKASSNDIWLHTKDIHGSHVIIKKQQNNIPENTVIEAAMLAAWYSKARMSSNVPVDYTEVRHVSKPSGAKPGMVIYVNNKTVYVTPDEKIIKKLAVDS